jgi:dihydrofolate reductase
MVRSRPPATAPAQGGAPHLQRAKAAAGEREVAIAGGASTVRQALRAGALDELMVDIVPTLLGAGERLFDGVQDPGFEPVDVTHSPRATHVRYVVRAHLDHDHCG